jgi:hypothetical protein
MKDDGMADILNQDSPMTIIFFKRIPSIIHSIRTMRSWNKLHLVKCHLKHAYPGLTLCISCDGLC